jgi:muconolactone delta-isomerase
MNSAYQYMVDLTLAGNLSEEFMDLIPYQRVVVNKFFQEGKLVNYALSAEKAKVWAIFNADSEIEVRKMINAFPLSKFMDVEISLLSQLDGQKTEPVFSLN